MQVQRVNLADQNTTYQWAVATRPLQTSATPLSRRNRYGRGLESWGSDEHSEQNSRQ
jgi:hypothetical protein